jgi:peptidoglycan-N-acetylglucosamine deacetylase
MSVVRKIGWRTIATSSATHTAATTPSAMRGARRSGAATAGIAGVVLSTVEIGSSVEGSTVARGHGRLIGVATGYGAAALAMPISALEPSPPAWSIVRALLAGIVAAAVAAATARRRARAWVLAGPVVAAAAAVLFDVSAPGFISILLGALAGAGAGLSSPRPWRRPRATAAGAVAGIVSVVVVRALSSPGWGLTVAVVATVVAAITTAVAAPTGDVSRHGWAAPVGALVASVALIAWSGANDPQLTWFGETISNGPATGDRVAITFDDGPNATATLEVRDVLDRYGVKATFFLVGKALDARPDIAKALLADGMLLGGHSYHHDQWRWLDPHYPELQRTIDAFKRQLGVCPRYYRPPHGQRTPFMSLLISRQHMKSVTWDVSAGDWATDDPSLIARRVLRDVQPGSVILLHDGLDGRVAADRSVIVEALPMILDGLRAKGLHPVRVDELVDQPAYVNSC